MHTNVGYKTYIHIKSYMYLHAVIDTYKCQVLLSLCKKSYVYKTFNGYQVFSFSILEFFLNCLRIDKVTILLT